MNVGQNALNCSAELRSATGQIKNFKKYLDV